MKFPSISTIIITKDRPKSLERCIKSLKKQSFKKFETIVVDTGNEESKKVCKKYKVKYVKEPRLGMPLARNTGIKNSKGSIIIFIDDDAEAKEDCIEKIIKTYTDDEIGAVGGREILPKRIQKKLDLKNKFNMFFLSQMNPFSSIKKIDIRSSGRVTGSFKENGNVIETKHIRGCLMSFRRDVLQKVKGFDNWYDKTSHREDTDISVRVSNKGYKILYNPSARVIHHGEPQGREERVKFLYNNFERHQYFVFKNGLLKIQGIPEYLFGEFLEILTTIIYAIYDKDLRYFSIIGAKIKGIQKGIIANHTKKDKGDL